MEKYGFVYIWLDCRNCRYYIGSHWGTIHDGYICSSKWMLRTYIRRPGDFKRRILKIVTSSKTDLWHEEQRWLDMIKREEIRQGRDSRYFNLSRRATGSEGVWYNNGVDEFRFTENDDIPEEMVKGRLSWPEERRQKWSGEGNPMSGKTGEQHHLFGSHRTEEQNRKQAEVMKGREPPNKGVPHTAEANEKNRQAHLGKKLSDDARQAFIEAGRKAMETVTPEQKQEWYDAASKRFKGVPLSEDHKQKLSEAKQRQFADRPLPPGVYLDKRRPNAPKPYEARITVDGKRKTIGMFATPEEASKAIRVQKSDHKSTPTRSKP